MMETIYIGGMQLKELDELFSCDIQNDDDFYDVVAYNIEKEYPGILISRLENLSGVRLRAALFAIGNSSGNRQEIMGVLPKYFDNADELVASAAIDSVRLQGFSCFWPQVKSICERADSAYVLGAGLRYASFALKREAIPVILKALADARPLVRENALDELAAIGDASLIPVIQPYLADPAPQVREAARNTLTSLESS